jgi:heme-degrading monooxygenase HmoA
MIVCLRTVAVPAEKRDDYLAWIRDGRAVRVAHEILAELVVEPTSGDGDTVVIKIWPSHEAFDAWIATPERNQLTASDVHPAVEYRAITRYDVAGGHLNLAGLANHDPINSAQEDLT